MTPGQGLQGCSEHVATELLYSCSCCLFLETLVCLSALSPPVGSDVVLTGTCTFVLLRCSERSAAMSL